MEIKKEKKSLSVIWGRNEFDNATVKECTQKLYSICKSPNLVIFTVILLISWIPDEPVVGLESEDYK